MKVVKYVPIYYVLVPLTAVKWMTTKNYCFFWPVVFFQLDTWLLCSFLFLTSNLQHNLPYFSIHCIPHIAKLICEFAHESGEYSDIVLTLIYVQVVTTCSLSACIEKSLANCLYHFILKNIDSTMENYSTFFSNHRLLNKYIKVW